MATSRKKVGHAANAVGDRAPLDNTTQWTGDVPPAATVVVKRIEGFFAKP